MIIMIKNIYLHHLNYKTATVRAVICNGQILPKVYVKLNVKIIYVSMCSDMTAVLI